MLTRKHFQLIADAIVEARRDVKAFAAPSKDTVLNAVIDRLAENLARTNPGFKPERFKAAALKAVELS